MKLLVLSAVFCALATSALAQSLTFNDATGQHRDLAALQGDGAACQMAAQQAVPNTNTVSTRLGTTMLNLAAAMQYRQNYFVLCMQSKGWQLQQ